MVNYLLVHLVE